MKELTPREKAMALIGMSKMINKKINPNSKETEVTDESVERLIKKIENALKK